MDYGNISKLLGEKTADDMQALALGFLSNMFLNSNLSFLLYVFTHSTTALWLTQCL